MDADCLATDASVETALFNADEKTTSSPPEFNSLRSAQQDWATLSVRQRLAIIRKLRHRIAQQQEALAAAVDAPFRRSKAETLAAEIIPLADACRFLEGIADRLLSTTKPSNRFRPGWLKGVSLRLQREPFGIILIVGAANYPLFLTGVQMLQALVAGNGVVIKPAIGASAATDALVELFLAAGIPRQLIRILPEAVDAFDRAVSAGVDKVVLTGSAETGRKVQQRIAGDLIPSTMELSGCDAVFVLPCADLELTARALAFGCSFNQSATCIAPRRVFIAKEVYPQFEKLLQAQLEKLDVAAQPHESNRRLTSLIEEALDQGSTIVHGSLEGQLPSFPLVLKHDHALRATNTDPADPEILRRDLFMPVLNLLPYGCLERAMEINDHCPYALGTTIFGHREPARLLASKVNAGCVVINDMIAPTADPRIPFGGRKQSGFGVTRGAEGLLAMTQVKAIIDQRSRWLPHLDEPSPHDAQLLSGFLQLTHDCSPRRRIAGLFSLVQAAMKQRKWKQERTKHDRS